MSTEKEEIFHFPRPRLDASGAEVVSSASMMQEVYMRPPNLGARIRKFLKYPQPLADRPDSWDDGDHLDYDDLSDLPPMSPYEIRFADHLEEIRAAKLAEQQTADEAEKQRLADEMQNFRKLHERLRAEGSQPPQIPTDTV